MTNPDIPFSTWTRSNLFPKWTRNAGALSVTDKFYCESSDFDIDQLAELETIEYNGLKISSSSAEPDESGTTIFITVSYTYPNSDNTSSASDGVSEFTMEDSGQEVPIDMRKQNGDPRFSNYRTNMNYNMAVKNGITTLPGYWLTAKDTSIPPSDVEKYQWVKEEAPAGWSILDGASKTKSIESVLVPSPVVVETTRYQSYNQAVSKRQPVGSKVVPNKTFGVSGEWLVMSSNVYADGKKWVCQTRYQNAAEWDGDFYK